MKRIYLRNDSETVITLRDMGVSVPIGGYIDISDYDLDDLKTSDRLRTAVANGKVVVNYEGIDLSIYEAAKIIDPANMLDIQKNHDINMSLGGSGGSEDYYLCNEGTWEIVRAFFFRGEDQVGEIGRAYV